MHDAPYKRCRICGETKPLEDFHKRAKAKDGRQSRCKGCACRLTREWNQANPERKRAADRAYREANLERLQAEARLAYRETDRGDRIRERMKAWREANPEASREKARRYYYANREAGIARAKTWRTANPERYRENVAGVRERDPERFRAHAQRYRDRKLGGFVREVTRDEIYERDGGICGICQGPVDRGGPFHLDHIIPVSRGGEHSPENIQLAHARCNQSKGAKLMAELQR